MGHSFKTDSRTSWIESLVRTLKYKKSLPGFKTDSRTSWIERVGGGFIHIMSYRKVSKQIPELAGLKVHHLFLHWNPSHLRFKTDSRTSWIESTITQKLWHYLQAVSKQIPELAGLKDEIYYVFYVLLANGFKTDSRTSWIERQLFLFQTFQTPFFLFQNRFQN